LRDGRIRLDQLAGVQVDRRELPGEGKPIGIPALSIV